MSWRESLLLLAAIPLSFGLALVCAFHSMPTPGQVALGLFPVAMPQGCCDLRPQGLVVLIDTFCWLLVFTAAYALLRGRRKLLVGMAISISLICALEFDGLAFRWTLLTPGLTVWRLLHRPGSSDYDPFPLG
jgi:hypothetical protein